MAEIKFNKDGQTEKEIKRLACMRKSVLHGALAPAVRHAL